MSKATRSKGSTQSVATSPKVTVQAHRKVFFIEETLLENNASGLQLERFYHAGKAHQALFITHGETHIMEVLEFAEPRRSWLLNGEVCSNGGLYITAPIDATFLALPHLREHCSEKARDLESIGSADDASTQRLLRTFVCGEQLESLADVKKAAGMVFYKYNEQRAVTWLALKTQRLAAVLRSKEVHCGHSALSQNYVRNEQSDEMENLGDALRMACDIVGDYIDLDLHDRLKEFLDIPTAEVLGGAAKENKKKTCKATAKRKSLKTLNGSESKKAKTEPASGVGAIEQLQNNSLLDETLEGDSSDGEDSSKSDEATAIALVEVVMSPKKERAPTAKEKALAKSAKGTRSIASFFKK